MAWGHAYESPLGTGATCSWVGKSGSILPSFPTTFCFFLFSTCVLLAQKFVIQCSSSQLVAFLFVFITIKVHRLFFHTYQTDGVKFLSFSQIINGINTLCGNTSNSIKSIEYYCTGNKYPTHSEIP